MTSNVHWPEFLIRGRNALERLYRSGLFALLLLRLKILRIPIVRTVHNLAPHEEGAWIERTLLRLCDAQTALFILLNAATDMGGRRNVVTILHGHYKDRFKAFHLPPARAGRFLYFGLIRPYKGVDTLLSVFARMEDVDVELRIVGKPAGELGRMVQAACQVDARISSRLEFVEDEVLVREIGEAEIVVLPYREMQNSGESGPVRGRERRVAIGPAGIPADEIAEKHFHHGYVLGVLGRDPEPPSKLEPSSRHYR